MKQFSFLDEPLRRKLRQAEEMAERHPDLSLTATRTFCEWLQDALADLYQIEKRREGEPQYSFTERLRKARIIPPHEVSLFNSIRKSANSATHSKGARALDARQKLMEAKALAFWYDQIRRDRLAMLSEAIKFSADGANAHPEDASKSSPEHAKIAPGNHAACESAPVTTQTQQAPRSTATDLKPIVALKSTQTEAQGLLISAATKTSGSTQRPPHKWLNDSPQVKRARSLLSSERGRRIQRKILETYGVKVRRAKEDCIYFEGPDQQAIALAEAEFFRRIGSPLSLVLGWLGYH